MFIYVPDSITILKYQMFKCPAERNKKKNPTKMLFLIQDKVHITFLDYPSLYLLNCFRRNSQLSKEFATRHFSRSGGLFSSLLAIQEFSSNCNNGINTFCYHILTLYCSIVVTIWQKSRNPSGNFVVVLQNTFLHLLSSCFTFQVQVPSIVCLLWMRPSA